MRLLRTTLLLALALPACTPAPAPTPSPTRPNDFPPPPSPFPTTPVMPGQNTHPSPGGQVDAATDQVLINFCVQQERVLGIEARLVTSHVAPGGAATRLQEASKIAEAQVRPLRAHGYGAQAAAVKEWSRQLAVSADRAATGMDPFDALHPATSALGTVSRLIDCELDA